ncbi:putative methyltransferase, LIC12133 family [Ectothiorhodosinus mongolicus]|uniref:Putative methyltransferase, LIC12133 family n=1 Tax=Ectothiorhodosinus mongolicus TaxID=233100 RepID=A0A1R3VTS9_9GAMM|nr:methyltransferase, TIGR04325 family [Ectothiorhodosinus mongolicus]ULX56785.1 methyltransferase, TIGR04325 family [Ectothiorhodosinus mongolicus]SIT68298.1 putative methyltransferase, LIC12133 family [Ectothiorhodosinus mongolicus]
MSAPIALFVYARPEHVRRTVESLLRNSEAANSDLIVFSDAARSSDKEEAVRQVREYVAGIEGFRSLTIHHRPENYGLSKSIIEGVSQVLTEHDHVIVMEDDLETSPFFLRYMNEALERYAEDDRVISVHGYIYPVQKPLPEAFFLRGADCWGWATWRRGWKLFNPDGQFLLDELKRQKLLKAFDFNGAYSYSGMLQGQINGTNDSWAVRWHASAFLANKLTLYPGRSLVHNIGNDSTGTHCGASAVFDAELSTTPIRLDDVVVEESTAAKTVIEEFLRAKRPPLQRILGRFMPENVRHKLTGLVKDWLPPVLARQLRRLSRLGGGITFEGPFATWDEAVRMSSGYDSQEILDKVLAATLKVKNGEAAYERDSVLFDEIQYAWPVTAGLMWSAARNGGRLSVLDFGGSLGSSYFQNREFLEGLADLRWSVVEQTHFVKVGKQYIQDERLRFYETIDECVKTEKPNVVLLSSVLQYLEKPYDFFELLLNIDADSLIIDRTPFLNSDADDLVKVQVTPSSIYSAAYPLWFFKKSNFVRLAISHGYETKAEFDALDRLDPTSTWKGMFFVKAK